MQPFSRPKKHISILTYLILTLVFWTYISPPKVWAVGGAPGDIVSDPTTCQYQSATFGTRYKCTDVDGSYTDATGQKNSIKQEPSTPGTLSRDQITKNPKDCKYNAAPYGVAYVCTDAAGGYTSAADVAKANAMSYNPTKGCDKSSDANPMIFTGLGCIPTSTAGFTAALLGFLAGVSGAIALIIMLIGTIQIMTGGDNAEQVKKGKELFTGAITGLAFIIFSVTLLKIVAGDIIKLPGFTN